MRKAFWSLIGMKGKSRRLRERVSGFLMVAVMIWWGWLGLNLCMVAKVHAAEMDKQFYICDNLDGDAVGRCKQCMGGDSKHPTKFWTGVGCLPVDTIGLTRGLITLSLGVAGLLLTVQIIVGAGEIIFSDGDSQKVQKARQRITSSVIAILFIVFGVAILQIIGVNILMIPGFFGN